MTRPRDLRSACPCPQCPGGAFAALAALPPGAKSKYDLTDYTGPVVCTECGYRSTFAWELYEKPVELYENQADLTPEPRTSQATTGGTMTTSTATGDVHDVETCDAQLDALDEDLQRINASVESIDEGVSDAGAAAERIKAWLESKNVEQAAVGGMGTVMEMLNPERIKELFDALDNARRGVQATRESLTPLREAAQMLNGADGSALNGR